MNPTSFRLLWRDHKKFIGFSLMAVLLLTIALFMSSRILSPESSSRKILSSLYISISPDQNEKLQVLKVLQNHNIFVEIYSLSDQGSFSLISRIDTHNKYDGYFLLGGNATNLAYINPLHFNDFKILVPGFDQNLIAYLNVIEYDPLQKSFTLLTKLPTIQK